MKKVIIAIAAVLVLAGVGLTLFFVLRNGGSDVIITVNGGTELNLTGDVGEVIRKVNESEGVIFNQDRYFLNYDKTGRVYVMLVKSPLNMDYDYSISFSGEKYFQPFSENPSCPGFFRYKFNIRGKKRVRVESLSLLDGWTGNKSDIYNYLNEKYSAIYPVEDNILVKWRMALFKNGKLVSIDELVDRYGKEAEKIIIDYHGDLFPYYVRVR